MKKAEMMDEIVCGDSAPEVVEEVPAENVTDYKQLYNNAFDDYLNVEQEKEALQKRYDELEASNKELSARYERLFRLYANNLDFYLRDGGNKD